MCKRYLYDLNLYEVTAGGPDSMTPAAEPMEHTQLAYMDAGVAAAGKAADMQSIQPGTTAVEAQIMARPSLKCTGSEEPSPAAPALADAKQTEQGQDDAIGACSYVDHSEVVRTQTGEGPLPELDCDVLGEHSHIKPEDEASADNCLEAENTKAAGAPESMETEPGVSSSSLLQLFQCNSALLQIGSAKGLGHFQEPSHE